MTFTEEVSEILETSEYYYCVTSTFDDHGNVTCAVTDIVKTESKPANFYREEKHRDIYLDFFDTLEEADEFVASVRRENATKMAV